MSLFSFLFSYYYNNVLKQAYSFLSFVTIIFSGQAKNAMFGTSHEGFPPGDAPDIGARFLCRSLLR